MPTCEHWNQKQVQRHKPRWWPDEEPWPPSGPVDWRNMRRLRGHTFRRVGCVVAALLFTLVFVSSALTWMIARASTPGGFPAPFHLVWPVLGFFVIVFVFGGMAFAFRSVRRAVLPISDLLEGVSRVAGGDYSQRVEERGSNEAQALARAFNEMTERLGANEQQRRDLLADVTHELRTPITVIQGNLEGMLDGIYPADADHLQSILEETRVLSRVVEDLRTLSLAEGGALKLQLQSTDLGELAQETADAYQAQAAAGQVSLCVEVPPELPLVEADPTRIREVLGNLVSNALRYTPAGGEIVLACRAGEAGVVWTAVRDSGQGIPAEDLAHIFDRFYKGRDSHGTGLGLAIVKSLVAAHRGEIQASSQPGQGTTIEFSLPVAP